MNTRKKSSPKVSASSKAPAEDPVNAAAQRSAKSRSSARKSPALSGLDKETKDRFLLDSESMTMDRLDDKPSGDSVITAAEGDLPPDINPGPKARAKKMRGKSRDRRRVLTLSFAV